MKKQLSVFEAYEYLRTLDCHITLTGNKEQMVNGYSSLKKYKSGSVTWIRDRESARQTENSKKMYTLIITNENVEVEAEAVIRGKNAKMLFFSLVEYISGVKEKELFRGENLHIAKTAEIAADVSIGNNCVIGRNVRIGQGTVIGHNVVIEDNVRIGKNCVIQSGSIIGGTGFGYSKEDGKYHAVVHMGGVTIGDEVEIGCNVCIDRGTLDDTIIENGVKIDNLCHIAHNVELGQDSMVIALSMIGGSAVVKEGGYIAPGVLVRNQTTIGAQSIVGMGAVVVEDVPAQTVAVGVPARQLRQKTADDAEKY